MERKTSLGDFASKLSMEMESRKRELAETTPGISQNFDEEEKGKILASVDKLVDETIDANSEDYIRGKKILMSRGSTEEEVDSMPFRHVTIIGSEQAGEVEVVEDKVAKPIEVEDVEVKVEQKKEEVKTVEVVKEVVTVVEEEIQVPDEKEIIHTKVKEMMANNIVKYIDKPMNSFRRDKENKRKKLLNREKRGKCCEMPLPNSNLRLNIYELRQSSVINSVTKEILSSSDMAMKYKAVKDILDRSEVLCSDGSTVDTDQLMNVISVDDLPWIQYGAAVANSVDKVPYTVRCEKCGTIAEISLDIIERVDEAVKSIPQDIITEFNPADDFKTCILKSKAGITAVVKDESARAKVYLSNPSLMKSIVGGDMTRKIAVSEYAEYLPQELVHANIDAKFEFLTRNHSTAEFVQLISALLLMSYIDKIEYYELDAPLDDWDNDKYLDMVIDENETSETMIEGIINLEESTIENIENVIADSFVKHAVTVTTGKWKCYKCKHSENESGLSGLLLLTTTLQLKMSNRG